MIRARLRLTVLILISAAHLRAQVVKLAPDLQQLIGSTLSPQSVLVQFKAPPTILDLAALQLTGAIITRTYSLVPAVAAIVPAPGILGILSITNVVYVSLDRVVQPLLDVSAPAVNAPAAWNIGLGGSGIGVAVIDSGIASHPDLTTSDGSRSRVVYRQNFIDATSADGFGHGTHVAGIIGGSGRLSAGTEHVYKGIAPNVSLIDLKVLDKYGASRDSVVIAAIERAVQLKSTYNIRILNLSVGRPIFESYASDPLCQAVTAAWKKGLVVVVAAGNLGRND